MGNVEEFERAAPTTPLLIEVPQDVVEAITKKRILKPDPSPKPTAAEIAEWSLPQGPQFELVFQHRVTRGGPVLAHPDGKSFFHAGDRLARWRIGSDEPQKIYHDSSTSTVTAVAIIEGQNSLLAGDDQGTLRIWDIDSGELLATRKRGKYDRLIEAVAVSPSSKTIAVTKDVGPTVFYDSMLQPTEKPDIKSSKAHLFFLDDDLLVLMGEGTEVWNTQTNEKIIRFSSKPLFHGPPVTPNGSSFVYKTLDGFKQWKRDAPDQLLEIPIDGDESNTLIYSPDGKLLAQSSASRLEIIDVGSRTRRQIWDVPRMTGMCWMPHSDLLVTTTAKGLIRIVGTPESASGYGLTPVSPKKVEPPANNLIPPTVDQLKAILDLRTLPKLPRFWPTTDYHQTQWYQTPMDIGAVRKFYRHVLGTLGWKEMAVEQQGLFNSNLKFQLGGHVLIVHTHQTSRNRTQPKNLQGVKPGSHCAINEKKVSNVSLWLADYLDMRSLPIYSSTSWEMVEEMSHRLLYRSNDSIVACEVELLRTLPPAGWVYLEGGSSTPQDTRFLRFAKNGCILEVRIGRDRTKTATYEIEVICRGLIDNPIPPDSEFLSLSGLATARSKMSILDLRTNLDSQMQERGWSTERLDADNLRRTIYTKGLQEVAYRFDMSEGETVVVEEPDREWVWRNYENSKQEVPAVAIPCPGAIAPPLYARVVDRTKAIEFVSSNSWDQLRTEYVEFLNERNYQCKPVEEEMDTLYFKSDRKLVRVRFESHAKGVSVIVDGKGVKWPYPLPTEKPILRNYSNWLEIKGRNFTLDHLHEFEVEMLKILEANNQTKPPKG